MTKTTKKAINTMMTAACAGAAFCCAYAASHTVILSVLGAIIMASIIISRLISIIGISLLVLVLLVVLMGVPGMKRDC